MNKTLEPAFANTIVALDQAGELLNKESSFEPLLKNKGLKLNT